MWSLRERFHSCRQMMQLLCRHGDDRRATEQAAGAMGQRHSAAQAQSLPNRRLPIRKLGRGRLTPRLLSLPPNGSDSHRALDLQPPHGSKRSLPFPARQTAAKKYQSSLLQRPPPLQVQVSYRTWAAACPRPAASSSSTCGYSRGLPWWPWWTRDVAFMNFPAPQYGSKALLFMQVIPSAATVALEFCTVNMTPDRFDS